MGPVPHVYEKLMSAEGSEIGAAGARRSVPAASRAPKHWGPLPSAARPRRAENRRDALANHPGLLAVIAVLVVASPARADQSVTLTARGFEPPDLTVDAGEAVHFSSNIQSTWSVTSDEGLFDSGE